MTTERTIDIIASGGYIGVFGNWKSGQDAVKSIEKQVHPNVFKDWELLKSDIPYDKGLISRLRHHISDGNDWHWGKDTPMKRKIIADAEDGAEMMSGFKNLNPNLSSSEWKGPKKPKCTPAERLKKMTEARLRKCKNYAADAKECIEENPRISLRELAKRVGCSVSWLCEHKKEVGLGKPVRLQDVVPKKAKKLLKGNPNLSMRALAEECDCSLGMICKLKKEIWGKK